MLDNSDPIRPFLEDAAGSWRHDPSKAGGGMFVDIGTHHLDLMLWLASAPAQHVSCFTKATNLPVEGAISVHATLSNGVLLAVKYLLF